MSTDNMPSSLPLRYLLSPRPLEHGAGSADDKLCPQVILGSIPACMPLYLGLNDLEATELQATVINGDAPAPVIITSSRASFHSQLVAENDLFLCAHAGDRAIAQRLAKLQLRHCSSSESLQVLTSLLHLKEPQAGSNPFRVTGPAGGQAEQLMSAPTMIIAWDLLELLIEGDDRSDDGSTSSENGHSSDDDRAERDGTRPSKPRLAKEASVHAYLQMLLSLRQTTDQLSQIHGRQIPLFILEPQADEQLRLPMRTNADVPAQDQVDAGKVKVGQTPRKPQRVRYMSVRDVLQWTFGEQNAVRSVTEERAPPGPNLDEDIVMPSGTQSEPQGPRKHRLVQHDGRILATFTSHRSGPINPAADVMCTEYAWA